MNSGNWIIDNIMNALNVWNAKLQEIWLLITQSPESFKGGGIWSVVVSINGALKAIGFALLVLFFVVGVVKTCGSFTEIKKPEHAAKLFIRFVLAKAVVGYGLDLMMALFREHRQELPEIVCRGMSGGSHHRVRVYHFQRVCLKPACGGRELKPRHNGVGVHGRVNLQPACADGRGKDG